MLNKGKQPCGQFLAAEMDDYGVVPHQCPTCWGWRYFCSNCYKDHHRDGWENCKPDAYKPPEAWDED